MGFIKITKRYKIKYSYGGVAQYAEFNEVDGVLYNPSFYPSWVSNGIEVPDVSNLKTIDEVLAVIKGFAYGKQAEIETINGMPVFFYNKPKTQKSLNDIENTIDTFIKTQAQLFFDTELKQVLKKNKWKLSRSHMGFTVLVEKDKQGEWDNVKNSTKEKEFEYLCERFLNTINLTEPRFKVHSFFNLVDNLDEFYLEE